MPALHQFQADGRPDHTPAIRTALADPGCRRLVFAPGRYDFHPERAAERYLWIANNDEGLKRIVFPLHARDDFEIDGGGALFVFHGGLVPFHLHASARVRLHRFTIDWAVPFHGEAEVLSSDEHGVELRVADGFPFAVEHGRLRFGPPGLPFEIKNILEFDPARRETAFLVNDNYEIGPRCRARELSPRRVRLDAPLSQPRPTPGNVLAIMGERRDFPAIVIDASRDIELADLAIRHAGGMGVIAQRSAELTLRRVRVAPSADGARLISTTADATHFVNCRGRVRLLDCVFENQMDDPANIHGIYARVSAVPAPAALELRLMHPQQFGAVVAAPGERVELIDGDTLATYHEATVVSADVVNKEYVRLVLDRAPARPPRVGDALGNLDWTADVEIRGCHCRGNRARGFLLSTPGKIIVEDNRLHVPGAAILIEGDANHWFESGAVRDVLVRRNHFDNCNYGVWGRACVQISPGIPAPRHAGSRYHRNIRIEENTFEAFDGRLVYARGVHGLRISGNRVYSSDKYTPRHSGAEPFDTAPCTGVAIEGNVFLPAAEPEPVA